MRELARERPGENEGCGGGVEATRSAKDTGLVEVGDLCVGEAEDLGQDLVPKERYTSAEFMAQEWEHIWTKVWLLGCREDQIPEPGDYVCTDIGRESVLLVRQRDGGVKAFHNVCMHRGNRLREPAFSATSANPPATLKASPTRRSITTKAASRNTSPT